MDVIQIVKTHRVKLDDIEGAISAYREKIEQAERDWSFKIVRPDLERPWRKRSLAIPGELND